MRLNKPSDIKLSPTIDAPRTISGPISTTSVDRDGDVVLPSGLDARNFMRHPVILLNHDAQKQQIGRMLGLNTSSDTVTGRIELHGRPPSLPTNIEWIPDTILDMAKMGAPMAFSIGFTIKESGARATSTKDRKRFGKDARRIITGWELLEVSVVNIPANQDALVAAVGKSGAGSYVRGAFGMPAARVTVSHRRATQRLVIEKVPSNRVIIG